MPAYHDPAVETMDRADLDALIDERVRYTVRYADEHSPFYRWPGTFPQHTASSGPCGGVMIQMARRLLSADACSALRRLSGNRSAPMHGRQQRERQLKPQNGLRPEVYFCPGF
ncbi:MAG: hypothetical protein A4E35_01467 [Methanoregula sp. PtaU1.Bin051]|nr:MAG: hypothetical protein A4E35_01467 [Methanoregula sp. PtaU1.Bin051]